MIFYISVISSIIIFANAFLHFLLLLGLPLGEYVLGGKHIIIPKKLRPLNIIFLILFTFAGISYLQYGNIIHTFINDKILSFIIIIFTIFFGYGIIGNIKFTKSKKEKNIMTPICIISFILSVLLIILKNKLK